MKESIRYELFHYYLSPSSVCELNTRQVKEHIIGIIPAARDKLNKHKAGEIYSNVMVFPQNRVGYGKKVIMLKLKTVKYILKPWGS